MASDHGNPVEDAERERVSASETSWALRAVMRAAGGLDQTLAQRLRMRPLDYAAMGHILNRESSLGPFELSTRLGISSGSATELVDRLERAGHVVRHRDPHDRRRVSLQPTESAVQEVLGALAGIFTSLDELAATFSEAEQTAIVRYLRGVAEVLRAYEPEPGS